MRKKILLGHGSGGSLMQELIRNTLLKKLHNPILAELSDSACLNYKDKLKFTTDSFVVSPLIFPGGDIGKLSVCGTVNDLVVSGAKPQFLSLAIIAEEGLEYGLLEKIIDSIASCARACGVRVVTGDFKVVEIGGADKIFINTAGIGRVIAPNLSLKNIRSGDKIITSGDIGCHGFSVLAKRKGLDFGFSIKSDCAPLGGLIIPLLKKAPRAIKFMRDPTRGGLATTLNEIAQGSGLGIVVDNEKIPVCGQVKAAGEMLGIDPLYSACEGRAVIIAESSAAGKIVSLLKKHSLGRRARIIGEVVTAFKKRVVLKTALGGERFLDMLAGDPLPRIC